MQGVLVYPPFTPYAASNNKTKLSQDRISSMDNMYFYRTRNWDDPPPMTPTCYVKPAIKPLYRPYERDKFGEEAIEAHNKYRAKHGAPELTLNPELCKIAQNWADHLAAEKAFEHSKTDDRKCSKGEMGENLFYSGSTGEIDINGGAAVDSWYSEIKDYDFEKPGFAMNTGHFTQVVWQGSTEFGFGFATYQDGEMAKVVVVGNYYPAGNIMKQFEDNVKPAKDEDCDKKSEKKAEKKDDKKDEPAKKAKGK